MSGQLVGEVIDAWPTLHKRGLSKRGFYALIAIAEKCHTQTRQGSVPWVHICDGLYGASKRTAERAVHDLQAAGVLEIVKVGYANQHNLLYAAIYRIPPLEDPDTAVSSSSALDPDTAVSSSNKEDADKTELDTDKTGVGYRHSCVTINGPINGPINGGARARAHEPPNRTAVPDFPNAPPGDLLCPKRIQLSNRAPIPPTAISVAGTSRWGNPFNSWRHGYAEAAELYAAWITNPASEPIRSGRKTIRRPASVSEIRARLAGFDLACWCPPDEPCHADVLLELANQTHIAQHT